MSTAPIHRLARPPRLVDRRLLLPGGRHARLHHGGLPVPRPQRRAGGPGRRGLGRSAPTAPAATPRSAPSSGCRSRSCPTRTTPSPSAYGAWGEKKNYGKTYVGIIRSSFLVGPDGRHREGLAQGQGRRPCPGRPRGAAGRSSRRPRRADPRSAGMKEGFARGGRRAKPRAEHLTQGFGRRAPLRNLRGSDRNASRRPAPARRRHMTESRAAHAPRVASGAVHGDRRAPRRRRLRAGRDRRRAGSTRAPQGWLVCCTSGDAGADDWRTDPLELAALREAEQRAAADVVGYAGHHVPPPARRRPGQRPRAARAARPRDPDLPARRRARRRPGDDLPRRRRRQPHGPPGGGPRGGRRGLPGGAQRDGVPVARPRRPRAAHRPAALPVLVEPRRRPGSTSRRRIDRKIAALRAHPSQIRHPEQLEPRIREWAKEEGEPLGRRGGRGVPRDRHRGRRAGRGGRRGGRGPDARHARPRPRAAEAYVGEERGPDPAPGVPHVGELARPGCRARPPSGPATGRPPGRPATRRRRRPPARRAARARRRAARSGSASGRARRSPTASDRSRGAGTRPSAKPPMPS